MLVQQVFIITLCFVTYYLLTHWISNHVANSVSAVVMQRLTGFVLLLLPSLLYFSVDSVIITKASATKTLLFCGIFSLLAILVNGLRKRTKQDARVYPHIRVSPWSTGVTVVNALTWMMYLLPYEFVFRGTLLHASLSSMEMWTAFAFNGLIYALAHAPQGARETIAAFPFGIVLCFITSVTGNFWSAYLIHVALALSNDYFALRHNAKLNFISTLTRQLWPSTKETTH